MKTCAEFEMEIMHAFYDEGEMSEDCKSHLATCESCQQFYETMEVIPREKEEIIIDEWVIQESVRAARFALEMRNRRERWIFLIGTLGLMGIGLFFLAAGFGSVMRNFYIGMYLGGPLLLPIIIWKRQQRGREHA